jgi:hypothetical protein
MTRVDGPAGSFSIDAARACIFRYRHLGEVGKIIPDRAYYDAFHGAYSDQLDQAQSPDACTTRAFEFAMTAACRAG